MTRKGSLDGKRILITGGSGFIGGHLVSQIVSQSESVAVISRTARNLPEGVTTFVGDLRDQAFVRDAVQHFCPNVIFHLGGFKERSNSPAAFSAAIDVNISGTLNLLLAAGTLSSLEIVVTLGTASEYGQIATPYVEGTREQPMNPYAFSRQCVTHLCELFHATQGLPVAILRATMAYGPRQGADMFVPALIGALLAEKTFPMTAGEQTRDYVFVSDVVQALFLAATKPQAVGRIINIGGGQPVVIADLARKIERMVGTSGKVLIGALPYRPGEAMDYSVDTSLGHELLRWTPQVSLEEGLQATINWFRATA